MADGSSTTTRSRFRIDNDKGYSPENCQWLTPKENSRKRTATKLNVEKVRVIKERLNRGETYIVIAKDYGVSPACVYSIWRRKTWVDV